MNMVYTLNMIITDPTHESTRRQIYETGKISGIYSPDSRIFLNKSRAIFLTDILGKGEFARRLQSRRKLRNPFSHHWNQLNVAGKAKNPKNGSEKLEPSLQDVTGNGHGVEDPLEPEEVRSSTPKPLSQPEKIPESGLENVQGKAENPKNESGEQELLLQAVAENGHEDEDLLLWSPKGSE
ncbi:hypothetical protein B9Z55_028098 [Caenorhabditis nigoni]|uniref:Uncharacterized protein n=2 Tax=Caenorhabditis nigoni TaxID=1611254 RepID=A0A2G5SD71_9PELO|nr:hypothetical protein B9Z55_028098 [Caenorhabditis nigoni]